jgi:hypothetical protein
LRYSINSPGTLIHYLLLLFFLTLYGINIYYLTSIDLEPPRWDEAVHLRDSLVFYNVFSNPSEITPKVVKEIINKSELYPLIRPSGYYPPFVPILTSLLYFLFGTSTKIAIISNIIFLSILIFSVYKLGTLVFDKNVGLLSCLLILLFPIVLEQSVVYMLDLPLAAIVALGIFTLIKTDYFKNTKYSIISGFLFGLGMLTKWTYLFFVSGPICYLVLKAIYLDKSQEKGFRVHFSSEKSFRNIFLFAFASVVTFGPYYFPILPALIEETLKYSHGIPPRGPGSLFTFASATFYTVALWKDMITPFGFILFATGIILLFFSKSSFKTFLLIWTLAPYFIFAFIIQKTPRFMMPWLVPISLIISFCILQIASFKLFNRITDFKRYAVSLCIIVFLTYFFIEVSTLRNTIINTSKDDWKINEIVSVIEEDLDSNKINTTSHKPLFLGVIPEHRYINGQTIRYYAAKRMLPLNVVKLENYRGTALQEFVNKFDRFDYLLTKNLSNSAIDSFQKSIDDMHNFFYSHRKRFEHLKTFHEPDGSEVSIFKRRQ